MTTDAIIAELNRYDTELNWLSQMGDRTEQQLDVMADAAMELFAARGFVRSGDPDMHEQLRKTRRAMRVVREANALRVGQRSSMVWLP